MLPGTQKTRTAAPNLTTFLPLVLWEGQTAHISLFVTNTDGFMIFSLLSKQSSVSIINRASAAVVMIDTLGPTSPMTNEHIAMTANDIMSTAYDH